MHNFLNLNLIEETFNIEEKMMDSIYNISKLNDFADVEYYDEQVNQLKVLYKKEKYLFSKIPDSIEVYNYIFDLLKKTSFGLKNEEFISARFNNVLYHNYLNLQLEYAGSFSYSDDDYDYDDLELKQKLFIRNNLLAEYLRSFDQSYKFADDKVIKMYDNIKLFNIFVNKYLFDLWVENGFDSGNIIFYNAEEMCDMLKISSTDYSNILNEIIFENCESLLGLLFTDDKSSKKNIISQDSFFNFKFLLRKISTSSLLSFKKDFSSNPALERYVFFPYVLNCIQLELDSRNDVVIDNKSNFIDMDEFDRVVNLLKFEDKLFDVFMEIDFSSLNNDFSKLQEMLLYEKNLVKDFVYSPTLFTILNDMFKSNIWIYVNNDVDDKIPLIIQRICNLLPFYNDLSIIPYQDVKSYEFINRNHLIRSLRELWNLSFSDNVDVINDAYRKIYKNNFYINPSLTDDLVSVQGNHLFLFDLSSDLSGFDLSEFEFDQNEQLYNLGCSIISFIFKNEKKINSIMDLAEFQFKLNELIDIISNLSSDYNKKLYRYFMDNTSFFSLLRHDLRKVFKDSFNKVKVKSN